MELSRVFRQMIDSHWLNKNHFVTFQHYWFTDWYELSEGKLDDDE